MLLHFSRPAFHRLLSLAVSLADVTWGFHPVPSSDLLCLIFGEVKDP